MILEEWRAQGCAISYFNVRFGLNVLPFNELKAVEADVKVESLEGWASQASQT